MWSSRAKSIVYWRWTIQSRIGDWYIEWSHRWLFHRGKRNSPWQYSMAQWTHSRLGDHGFFLPLGQNIQETLGPRAKEYSDSLRHLGGIAILDYLEKRHTPKSPDTYGLYRLRSLRDSWRHRPRPHTETGFGWSLIGSRSKRIDYNHVNPILNTGVRETLRLVTSLSQTCRSSCISMRSMPSKLSEIAYVPITEPRRKVLWE